MSPTRSGDGGEHLPDAELQPGEDGGVGGDELDARERVEREQDRGQRRVVEAVGGERTLQVVDPDDERADGEEDLDALGPAGDRTEVGTRAAGAVP